MAEATRFWKRFASWVTGSGRDQFSRASLRLAAVYLGLTTVLVAAFSLVLYLSLARNIESNVEGDFETEAAQARFVTETVDAIGYNILLADAGILIVVSGLAYVLAHRTLRPVRGNFEAQQQFVSNASHELRTPLTILRTEFEVARRADPASLDILDLLDRGLEEIGRMSRIVDDLLTLSRIDADQEPLSFSEDDVAALVEHVAERMRTYADGYGVQVSFTGGGVPTLPVDADHLERALVNVVKNAIEHSPSGATVRIDVVSDQRGARIEVRDSGEGISEEDLPHAFERFYRAKASTFRARGGSGLGLSIAKWIVEGHRGTIRIDSAEGQGTTVVIALPATRPSRVLHAGAVR
jgi:signal transduction histidine kinase